MLDQIAGRPRPTAAGWLDQLRRAEADRVSATGLPHRKVEAWRFTPIAPLDQLAFSSPPDSPTEGTSALRARAEERLGGDDDCYRVWMVNGVPIAATNPPAGVTVQPLVLWLWIGGGIVGFGTVLAAFPGRRRRPTAPVSEPGTRATR